MPRWFDHSIQENLLEEKSLFTEGLQWSGVVCLARDMHNLSYKGLISKQLSVLPFRGSDFQIAAEGLKKYVISCT